jgi:hypothetical protein
MMRSKLFLLPYQSICKRLIQALTCSTAETWIRAVIAHIHIQYKKEHNIKDDYWGVGEVGISIWRVPLRPEGLIGNSAGVGIRTLPLTNGKLLKHAES